MFLGVFLGVESATAGRVCVQDEPGASVPGDTPRVQCAFWRVEERRGALTSPSDSTLQYVRQIEALGSFWVRMLGKLVCSEAGDLVAPAGARDLGGTAVR